MANVWFTADLHLGHGNIIKYCLRPFMSKEEEQRALEDPRGKWRISEATLKRHDNALLDTINAMVQSRDTLWILGDFCWGGVEETREYLGRIRCRNVRLVWGNHDHRSLEPMFRSAVEQGMVSVAGQSIWLNHYPMRSWNKSFHGSWHLYGHVHGRLVKEDQEKPWLLVKDVGVDACDYQPLDFEMLRAYMEPRVEAFRQRRREIVQHRRSAGPPADT